MTPVEIPTKRPIRMKKKLRSSSSNKLAIKSGKSKRMPMARKTVTHANVVPKNRTTLRIVPRNLEGVEGVSQTIDAKVQNKTTSTPIVRV